MSKQPDRAALIAAVNQYIRAKQRDNAHYGRAQFARDAGVAKSTITDILNGKTKNISSNTLSALLGVINDQLLVYRTMYPRDAKEAPNDDGGVMPPDIVEMYRSDPGKVGELNTLFAKMSPRRRARALEYLRGLGAEDD